MILLLHKNNAVAINKILSIADIRHSKLLKGISSSNTHIIFQIMENKMHLTDLHSEHNTWIKHLDFYKDECSTIQNRLAEIISANNKIEVTAQVEHFQNQLIRQNEVIDILKHDIHKAEAAMAEQVEANPVATDRKTAPDHVELRSQFETFEKLFAELKTEFNTFAAKTL